MTTTPSPSPAIESATHPPGLRASDADRESAVAELRRHHAEGRLTIEELESRAGAVYRARTLGELAPQLGDLPSPPPPLPPRPSRWRLASRVGIPLALAGGVAIGAVLSHHSSYVGVFPIFGLIYLRRGMGSGRGRGGRPGSPPRTMPRSGDGSEYVERRWR